MKRRFCLLSCGLLSCAVYSGMTWVSSAFVYGQGHRQRPFLTFLGLYAAAFLLYWVAVRRLSHIKDWPTRSVTLSPSATLRVNSTKGLSERFFALLRMTTVRGPVAQRQNVMWFDLGLILGFACLFRVLVLWSNPIQEDDFYRYLWDGKVVASGLNPYRFAPQVIESVREGDDSLQPYSQIVKADPAMAVVLARVNHPDVPTIYPPLAQGVFALAACVAPGNLQVLRLLFLAFDVGLGAIVIALLQRLAISPVYVLIYAWSPLVIKESLNSVHYDVVPTFFFIGSLWLALQGKTLLAHGSLALAILGKVYPLLFLPLLGWRTWQLYGRAWALSGLIVTVVVIVLGYLPFLTAGPLLWQGTQVFAERWQTNSALFPLLAQLVGERWLANTIVVLLLGGAVITVLVRHDQRDEREFLWSVFLLLGALFLLSPVGNPWYLLWLIPLLCVFPLRSWLLLSGLLGLYYLSFYFIYHRTPETFRWVLWLEYMPFYSILVWEWVTGRVKSEK